MKSPRVRYISARRWDLASGNFPSFHRSGSVRGMRNKFYGSGALLVQQGQWIYNVTSNPRIYDLAH